ncbi:LOB domain-containing protein 24-like [Gastrolobium bilobum]|uniref:LOB domain-containing protein 24-like n=1 Tax=Gastrolobium bilobum TaxID=150636 RepID=UPI002AB095C0|nr:LOB domain-containing protein 24-like [Gastrolobium bilobum]
MSKERDRTRRGSRAPYTCGGCKWMRKKCGKDCLLAPHFPPQNTQEFEACQGVFGFSNMQRMLRFLGEQERQEAANSMKWEASMWTQDPVSGPLGQYKKLQQENNNLINLLNPPELGNNNNDDDDDDEVAPTHNARIQRSDFPHSLNHPGEGSTSSNRVEQEGQQCIQQQTHTLQDSDESQLNSEEKMTENR